jgi:hypothetical protein
MTDQHVYRVRSASSGWPGAPGLNTFYFNPPAGDEDGSLSEAQLLADRVRAFWIATAGLFPLAWTVLVDPTVDLINTDNGDLLASFAVTPPAVVAGTTALTFGPQVTMLCARYLTADIIDSRHVAGKGFFGPLCDVMDADGTPQASQLTILGSALDDLLSDGDTHGIMAVWSRRRGTSLRHPTGLGGSAHIISAVTVKDSFAILRTRRA